MDQSRLQFGKFELKISSYELTRAGLPVKLERIPMELLLLLVEKRGELVSREMIVQRLWGQDVFLETEHSINTAINKLRAVLKDHPREPIFVQTVIGKGYRFIAEVKELASTTGQGSPEPTDPTTNRFGPTGSKVDVTLVTRQLPELLLARRSAEGPADDESVASPADVVSDPQEQTPASVRRAGVVAALAVLLAAGLGLLVWGRRDLSTKASMPQYRSVAVLPFVDLSPHSEKEYLVDGMTDEVTTLLAQGSSLRVISRTSTMQYKNVRRPLTEIATALKVDAVVEGSIVRDGASVRITAQLLDARRDQHLWAQSYRQSDTDSLQVQDQVAAAIAQEVAQRLGSQMPIHRERAVSPQARELYLRGLYFWNKRTFDSLERSLHYYRQAIEMDPEYAEAYAAMGGAYVLFGTYGAVDPSTSLLQARNAAEKALELDDSLGDAHTVLAAVKVDHDWDWQGAEEEFRQAIRLSPNSATAHHWYGLHLSRMRRYREAEVEMQRALALDPLSVIIQTDAAEVLYCARKPDEAQAMVLKALDLDANFAEAHLVLGKIYEEKGQFKDAVAEFQRAAQMFGNSPNIEGLEAHALALSGDRAKAQTIVDSLKEQSEQRYISGVDIALVQCALGNVDGAMQWLDRGFEVRDKGMDILGTDPLFDGCRSDPRFRDLLLRMKLNP